MNLLRNHLLASPIRGLIPGLLMLPFLLVGAALQTPAAQAAQIDLSLNIFFTNPVNPNSGGTWEVVAKSDEDGIHSVNFDLSGISPAVDFEVPFGTVNGGADQAGFVIRDAVSAGSFTSILVSQAKTATLTGPQVGEFYGFGTLENGTPNFPGKVAGTNSLGPNITSLGSLNNPRWAVSGDIFSDPVWDTAAAVASGTFSTGNIPAFVNDTMFAGKVFTSVAADANAEGGQSSPILMNPSNMVIRTNQLEFPDFNDNGIVDAADYTLWRDTLGDMVPIGTGADADRSGVVDQADYDLWKDNFGQPTPAAFVAAVASANAVPEPASAAMLGLLGCLLGGFSRRNRRSRMVRRIKAEISEKVILRDKTA